MELSDKLGVIRQDGTYLIRPEYDSLMPINCGLYVVQKGIKWGVVSILPFSDGQGGATQVLYDLSYDSIQVVEQGGSQVLELTRNIVAEKKITCLMVTHNMHQALELGNRTLMMDAGRIVFDVQGEERSRMTVDDLLEKFRENAGKALDNDRILLSKVEANN